eukprot:1505034-Prymnesium_polylepis.1
MPLESTTRDMIDRIRADRPCRERGRRIASTRRRTRQRTAECDEANLLLSLRFSGRGFMSKLVSRAAIHGWKALHTEQA